MICIQEVRVKLDWKSFSKVLKTLKFLKILCSRPKKNFFNFVTKTYLNLILFCNCHPQTCSFFYQNHTHSCLFRIIPKNLWRNFFKTFFSQTFTKVFQKSIFEMMAFEDLKDATFRNEGCQRFSECRNLRAEWWFAHVYSSIYLFKTFYKGVISKSID